jgi:hypothetical protein
MNCHIPDSGSGESNLTPTLERMSVNETSASGREIVKIQAGDPQGNQVEEMDTMIPLARLPGSIIETQLRCRKAWSLQARLLLAQ